MTIEFDGHVHSMSMTATAPLDVSIELRVEGIRSIPNITVNASHAEVAHYKVGMPVKIQIRPAPQASDSSEHGEK